MFVIISLLLLICYIFYRYFFPSVYNIDSKGKFVLISGCDTGFGHETAIQLDRRGFHVLAGVFLDANISLLESKLSSRATVFHLDITKQDNINAVYELVRTKTQVLHALVNNAGVSSGGYIDWMSMECFRRLMDVNFFGHVAMTKQFLPLLLAKKDSRIVNMSSMCGFINFPGASTYSASKHALEAFADCLRREMFPWNLRVSLIEPGAMSTGMVQTVENDLRKFWTQGTVDARERWGDEFFNQSLLLTLNSPTVKYAENPMKVVRAIEHAVSSSKPRIRYRPGWQSSCLFFPLSLLPAWLLDKIISLTFSQQPIGVKHQIN